MIPISSTRLAFVLNFLFFDQLIKFQIIFQFASKIKQIILNKIKTCLFIHKLTHFYFYRFQYNKTSILTINRNTTSPSLTYVSRTSRNISQNQKGPALHILSLERYYRSDTYIYYGRVLPIITSIVVVLNILLIVTIIKGKFRTSTYVVMVAIAIADCLTGLVPLPFNIYVFGL